MNKKDSYDLFREMINEYLRLEREEKLFIDKFKELCDLAFEKFGKSIRFPNQMCYDRNLDYFCDIDTIVKCSDFIVFYNSGEPSKEWGLYQFHPESLYDIAKQIVFLMDKN